MARPRDRVGWVERVEVAVETAVGSGAFAVDDRLRADTAETLSDGQVGTARIAVRTDDDFASADAAAKYYANRRIIVRTATAILFDGYPSVEHLTWSGSGTGAGTSARRRTAHDHELTLELEHVLARLGRDPRGQIIGRHVRDGVIVDGMAADPEAWSAASVPVRGLPCVFNMNGVGNCDPVPIKVSDGNGGLRDVYIFTDDARLDAVPWTYARIYRYLLHWYVWSDCPVGPGQVFEQTATAASMSGEGREALAASDPLVFALLASPDTLVLEAANLLEAVALLAAASGVHLTAESTPAARGVRTQWRIWSDLSGPEKELHLATDARDGDGLSLYDPATVAVVDLFADNNVSASSMRWDARSIGETAMVIGDVKRYEVQVELSPGWWPETDLDNVDSAQRADAKAKALTEDQVLALGDSADQDSWHTAYHRSGSDFASSRQVGRLWVLNEAETYDPAQYNRNAPFDSYVPHDFSTVLPGRWMRRRRRFLPVAASGQVRLEVSFDGGGSWWLIDSGCDVLSNECGIWFNVANPLSIAPPGAAGEQNLWYALIDQTCRVRVTALIESDQRVEAQAVGRSAPTVFRNSSVLYAPDRFRFLRRLEPAGGGDTSDGVETTPDRDDTAPMNDAAESLAASRGSQAVTARPVVPWLDTSYEAGDRIIGVRGRGIRFCAERVPSRRHTCVIGKRYRFDGGRFETELVLASIVVGDAGTGI